MRPKTAKIPISEAQFQERVVDALRGLGYTVWVTSARSFGLSSKRVFAVVKGFGISDELAERIAQSLCTKKGYGSDRGIPDLLVRRNTWPSGTMFGAELKGRKTVTSVEQRIFEAEGHYGVYRTLSDLLEALASFEGVVAGGQPGRVRSFMVTNPNLD